VGKAERKAKWQAKTMGFESLPSAIIVSLFFQTILPISGRAGEITSI
jgi:hypothetical protein